MKTAQDYIDEYNESKKEYIIPIAEFCSRGIEGEKIVKVNVIKLNGEYYYQTYDGYKSTRYKNLDIAKSDIISLYGKYHGFKLLI